MTSVGTDPAAIAAAGVEPARDPELRAPPAGRGERRVRTALSCADAAERAAAAHREGGTAGAHGL